MSNFPLKLKYRTPKPKGFKSKSSNSQPKKRSMAAMLYASAKRRG